MIVPPPAADESSASSSSEFQIRNVVERVIKDYWDAVQNNLNSSRPYTGIDRFDAMTCGLASGVHIIAGRPSMGKTSLMLNIIETICVERKIPSLIFSGDYSTIHLTHRLIFSRAFLPTRITYANASYPNENEKASLRKSASEIAASPLFIEDSLDMTVESIRSIATRYKQHENIGFIAIESLDILRTNFTRIELSREREVVEIVAKLRGLARELDIPILLIAGLGNGPENRVDPLGEPRISDLPYHNLIEGIASTVSLLFRPSYYAASEDDRQRLKGRAELILCKNADGITSDIILEFDESCSRFTDISHQWFC